MDLAAGVVPTAWLTSGWDLLSSWGLPASCGLMVFSWLLWSASSAAVPVSASLPGAAVLGVESTSPQPRAEALAAENAALRRRVMELESEVKDTCLQRRVASLGKENAALRRRVRELSNELDATLSARPVPQVPAGTVSSATARPGLSGSGDSSLSRLCARILRAPEPPVESLSAPLSEEVRGLVREMELAAPDVRQIFYQLTARMSSRNSSSRRPRSCGEFTVPYLQQVLKAYPSASQFAHALVHTHGLEGTKAAGTLISSMEGVDHLLRWGSSEVLESQELEDLCREAYRIEHAGELPPSGLLALRGSQPRAIRVPKADAEACQNLRKEFKARRLIAQLKGSSAGELS